MKCIQLPFFSSCRITHHIPKRFHLHLFISYLGKKFYLIRKNIRLLFWYFKAWYAHSKCTEIGIYIRTKYEFRIFKLFILSLIHKYKQLIIWNTEITFADLTTCKASLTRDPVTFNVAIFSCHQKRLAEKLLPLFIEGFLVHGWYPIFNNKL